jgi:hypothetical protein
MTLPYSLEQESFFGPDPVASSNIGVTHRLDGPLDPAALSRAASALLARHEGLRFRVGQANGQRIAAADPVRLDPVPVAEDHVWDRMDHDYRVPLDLVGEGPVRFRLYQCGAGVHYLATTVHPAALDAWGVGIVTRELWALYHGLTGDGGGADLPVLPLSFTDHLRGQQAAGPALTGPQLERHLDRLTGLRRGSLPWRPPDGSPPPDGDPAETGLMLRPEGFQLGGGMLAALARAARQLAITQAACFLAGFELALGIAAGAEEGGLSCIYLGRDKAGSQPMAAAMARRIPLRFCLAPDTSLGDFCRLAMQDWASAIGDSGPPYSAARLVRAAGGPLRVLEPVFNLRVSRSDAADETDAETQPGDARAGAPQLRVERTEAPNPRPVPMWPQFGRAALFALVTLDAEPEVAAVYDPRSVPAQVVQSVFRAYQAVLRVLAGDPAGLSVGDLVELVTASAGTAP